MCDLCQGTFHAIIAIDCVYCQSFKPNFDELSSFLTTMGFKKYLYYGTSLQFLENYENFCNSTEVILQNYLNIWINLLFKYHVFILSICGGYQIYAILVTSNRVMPVEFLLNLPPSILWFPIKWLKSFPTSVLLYWKEKICLVKKNPSTKFEHWNGQPMST